ncbi:HEAT repeat-containing protein 1 [Smittium mucronatum]|uniref:U3 small nucleolar RNA-associated protein 10 n=1 Tax=Smittium mucronatum TaxID=133383 RepID=A0A1R0H6C1_9FUNG|nr:HEAT repeat-containing protein 1 [Smittium mucronatum]OLY84634.1 HEAT repeat-containing protein 1 [Smittium mucronatum]
MSLAQQLYRIQAVDRLATTEKALTQRASLIFDSKRASELGIDDIYEIGLEGLNSLIQMDSNFTRFSATLFSLSYKNFDRILKTQHENLILDDEILDFLFCLGPYFLTKPAGLALEWLLRRFRIEEFNSKELFATFLPYHYTNAFLAIITAVRVPSADMNLLGFLPAFRKSRQLLDRNTIVQQMKFNRAFAEFVNDYIYRAFRFGSHYDTLVSFYSSINVEYVDSFKQANNEVLNFQIPLVFKGLSIKNENVQTSNYLILSVLSGKFFFSNDVFERLVQSIIKNRCNDQLAAYCFIKLVISQNISSKNLSDDLVSFISNYPDFFKVLDTVPKDYFATAALSPFLEKAVDISSKFSNKSSPFINILINLDLSSDIFNRNILEALLMNYANYWLYYDSSKETSDNRDYVLNTKNILIHLFFKFPTLMETSVSKIIEQVVSISSEKSIKNSTVDAVFSKIYEISCSRFNPSTSSTSRKDVQRLKTFPVKSTGSGLYVSLNSFVPEIRLTAVRELSKLINDINISNKTKKSNSFDFEEVSSLVIERLKDHDPKVLAEILKLDLLNYLSPSVLVSSISDLVNSNLSTALDLKSEISSQLIKPKIFSDSDTGTKAIIVLFVLAFNASSPVYTSLEMLGNLSKLLEANHEFRSLSKISKYVAQLKASKSYTHGIFFSRMIIFFSENLFSLDSPKNQIIITPLAKLMFESSNSLLKSVTLISFAIFSSVNKVSSQTLTFTEYFPKILDYCFSSSSKSQFLNKNSNHVKESIKITGDCYEKSLDDWFDSISNIYQTHSNKLDNAKDLLGFTSLSILIKCLGSPESYPKNTWLSSYEIQDDSSSKNYFNTLKKIYSLSISESQGISLIGGVIIGQLYTCCLKDEWVQFLLSFAIDNQSPSYLRVLTIHVLATFIKSSVPKGEALASDEIQMIDYQILIPSIMSLLYDSDQKIRAASVILLNSLDYNYDYYFSLVSGKNVKKSKKDKLIEDAAVYKSFEFYGNNSKDLQYLPTDVAAYIVKIMASQSNELESNATFISSFVQIATGTLSSTSKAIRKLNSKGYGNALVTVALSHACCAPNGSISTDVFSQTENSLLNILCESVKADQYYLVYSALERYINIISSKAGIPSPDSFVDKNFRLVLKCFNTNIIDLNNTETLEKQGIDGGKSSLPFNKFLELVKGSDISNIKRHELEADSFESWDNVSKASAYFQSLAFSHLSKDLSSSLDSDKKSIVLDLILNISSLGAISTFIPGNSVTIKEVFSSLDLSPIMVSDQLYSWASKLNDIEVDDSEKTTKKQRNNSTGSLKSSKSETELENIFSALVVLLEMISSQSAEVKNSPLLINPLFELLASVNGVDRIIKSKAVHNDLLANSGSDKSVSKEYSKQLVINILLDIFNKTNEDNIVIDDSLIRVDVIVNVLRSSTSLQSQSQALLLLASIASQHSGIVLHHVMAIFTFMGDSVLRQDDSYTLHVISQAVVKIIPSLLKSSANRSDESGDVEMSTNETKEIVKNKSVISVLRVFVDSLPYIPQHRRLPLFKLLLETIGVEEYGSYMFILILEKYSIKQTKSSNTKNDQYSEAANIFSREDYMDFLIALSLEFDPKIIISVMIGLVNEMLTLPADKPTNPDEMNILIENTVLDLTRLNLKQQVGFRLAVTDFINKILSTNDYENVDDKKEKLIVDQMLETLVFVMLEFVTVWNDQFKLLKSKSSSKSVAKLGEMVVEGNYLMIDYAVGQLDYSLFSRTVLRLLGHKSFDVRRKILELLSIKIDEFSGYLFDEYDVNGKNAGMESIGDLITENSGWSSSDVASAESLVELIPSLLNVIETHNNGSLTGDDVASSVDITQSAILCLSTLSQYFSSIFYSSFLPIFDAVLGIGKLKGKNFNLIDSENQLVRSSLFALLARLINGLGIRAIAYMPKLMPILLKLVNESFSMLYNPNNRIRQKSDSNSNPEDVSTKLVVVDNSTELVAGALVVLENIAKKWSNFLNPYIRQIFEVIMDSRVCYLSLHPELPFLPKGFGNEESVDGEESRVQGEFESGDSKYEFSRKDLTLRKKAAHCYNNLLGLISSSVSPRILLEEQFNFYESILKDGRMKAKMDVFSLNSTIQSTNSS